MHREKGCTVTMQAPPGSNAHANGQLSETIEFDGVLQPQSTQANVFNSTAKPLVDALPLGRSSVLFTYGVTNSGKSFTIVGTDGKPGLLHRSLARLFSTRAKVMRKRAPSSGSGTGSGAFRISLSVVEVHNESLRDLLYTLTPEAAKAHPGQAQPSLKLRENQVTAPPCLCPRLEALPA